MVNQQILDYIKQQVQQGVSREQIKSSLMTNGWSPSDIDEAFNAISPEVSGIPVAPVTNIGSSVGYTNPVQTVSYAGFWLRVVASFIDGFILNLVYAVVAFVFFWFVIKNNPQLSSSLQTVTGILYPVIWILYFSFMESHGGATFGKKIIGIKVLNVNGEPVSFLKSVGRNLAKIISVMILMIGFLMAGFTKKKQGLHDMITGSIVVKSREVSAGKIWAAVILIIVACIATVVIAVTQFFFIISFALSSLFSGGINIQGIPTDQLTSQSQNDRSDTSASSDSIATPLSSAEYDAYFSKPITGLDGDSDFKGPHTYAGPALLAFDDFWGLNCALPYVSILEDNKDYVWVDLTSVISKSGKEILDKESTFEKDIFFKGLNLSKETQPFEFLSDNRTVHLTSGSKSNDVQTIKGTLFFKVPLDENNENYYEKSYPFTINVSSGGSAPVSSVTSQQSGNNNTAQTQATAKSPKDTYIEYVSKFQQTKTLQDAMNLTMSYGYFATPAEKSDAIASAQEQINALSDADKLGQLTMMKSFIKIPTGAKITETISGNTAVIKISNPDGSTDSVNMEKHGSVWTLKKAN